MLLSYFKKRKIDVSDLIICPSCSKTSEIDEWNSIAQEIYGDGSPDIRNAALNKKISFPFQCPKCYKGFSAYSVKFK